VDWGEVSLGDRKNNRRSFDCVCRECAANFAQDDTFIGPFIFFGARCILRTHVSGARWRPLGSALGEMRVPPLIGVVLLQQGSADLAAAFGGQGPQTSTSLSVGMTLLK